jgi:hypothetical protein
LQGPAPQVTELLHEFWPPQSMLHELAWLQST